MEHCSIWTQATRLERHGRLEADIHIDVAIIGAGMAGLLTAYQLQKRGIQAVVLEASHVASGQTKNTTAKITSQHGMIYDALIKRFGEEKAQQYATANELAIREYAAIIRENQIACGFEEVSSYLYTKTNPEPMHKEAEAARRLGIDTQFTTQSGLPFSISGAVRFDGQAQFHPLQFVNGITSQLTIYENTPALSAEAHSVITPSATVTADKIVFCTHFPFVNVPGWYFMRMHQERSYVLAVKSRWLPDGYYYGVDPDGLSLRQADGLLLIGGENHRTGENSAGGRYEALSGRARELDKDAQPVASWSAQDCITLDGVPYIGGYALSMPSWYVATGFGKWGMTSSMVSALLIAGDIAGERPDWADVFSPARLKLSASAKSLSTDTAQACKGLARSFLSLPQTTLDALPLGHGGIVEADRQKAGVYKAPSGKCHLVDPRCPHLGCQVEWNPDEKSWDCPCHGSRFRYDGSLIDNPAQEGLV